MKLLIVSILLSVSGLAFAEEKSCTVKGMHCDACVDMIKDRVCEGKGYEVCDVTIKKEAKAKVGLLHIKTKDATAKVDEKAISSAIADTTYSIEKCAAGKKM